MKELYSLKLPTASRCRTRRRRAMRGIALCAADVPVYRVLPLQSLDGGRGRPPSTTFSSHPQPLQRLRYIRERLTRMSASIMKQAKLVFGGAHAAYASGRSCAALEARGVRLISPPPKPITYTDRGNFTVEDFAFNESLDEFVCPAGERLHYVGADATRPDRRRYQASSRVCGGCKYKARCTRAAKRQVKVSSHHAALVRLRADSKTDSFRKLYKARAPVIEGMFAEAKQWHGLGRAWRRGLLKMRVQCLLIAAVINFKRLTAHCDGLCLLKMLNVLFGIILHTLRRVLSTLDGRLARTPLLPPAIL